MAGYRCSSSKYVEDTELASGDVGNRVVWIVLGANVSTCGPDIVQPCGERNYLSPVRVFASREEETELPAGVRDRGHR